MAILQHVLSESDELVNEEITVEVLSRETALVEMVKSRAGSRPSRITTVGHDVLALHGTRGIQIAEKSSMDIDDFHQFLVFLCDKGRGDGWCRCLSRDVDAFREFQQLAPLQCNVNVAQAIIEVARP